MSEEMNNDCSINSLPNEILIKIFQYFDLDDLNSVSLVCKRWLDLSSTLPLAMKFPFVLKGDLKTDAPPISILLNSQRAFPFIGVKSNLGKEENLNCFLSLMETIGRNVKCLHLHEMNCENLILDTITDKCPALKTLELDLNFSFHKWEKVPQSLNTIIIDSASSVPYYDREGTLEKLISMPIKNLFLKNYQEDLEYMNSELSLIEIDEELMNFMETNSREINRIRFQNTNVKKDQSLQFKHVEVLEIWEMKSLMFSEVEINYPISLNLDKFSNLKTISVFSSNCLAFHTIKMCPTIETVALQNKSKSCLKCLESMLESFPNLKNIEYRGYQTFNQEHFRLLSAKGSKITKLLFEFEKSWEKIDEPILSELTELKELHLKVGLNNLPKLSCLPKLETLSICAKQTKQKRDQKSLLLNTFESWGSKMPNLSNLSLATDYLTTPEMMCIFQKFPKIRTFKLKIDSTNSDEDNFKRDTTKFFLEFEELINVIIQNGTCLKTVVLYSDSYQFTRYLDIRQERPEWVLKMFSAMDKLQTVLLVMNNYRKFTRYHTFPFKNIPNLGKFDQRFTE